MSYTILSGRMYIWEEGHEELLLAEQLKSVSLANSALKSRRLTVRRAGSASKLIGLAIGRGHTDLLPVNLYIKGTGTPLFSCPIVCTTGRVVGLPGELGYFGAKTSRLRHRSWLFSVQRSLTDWRRDLRLPEIWGIREGVFRLTTTSGSRDTRTQIFREIRDGGKYRCP